MSDIVDSEALLFIGVLEVVFPFVVPDGFEVFVGGVFVVVFEDEVVVPFG